MPSQFDDAEFNRLMFAPRPRRSSGPPPANAQDLHLAVAPDVVLHARWHPDESSRATILLFHGNGEIVADYDRLAVRYHEEVRADLVVIDFRGYGLSSGRPDYRACIADASPVVQALRDALGARLRSPLIVLGRSLGAACAAELGERTPALVDGIILESAASDPIGIIQRRGLVPQPLSSEDSQTFDPRRKLARCALPALLLHGARDETIPPREARENFKALASRRKRLVFIRGRGHSDLFEDRAYYSALRAFVAGFYGETAIEESPSQRERAAALLDRAHELASGLRARLRQRLLEFGLRRSRPARKY